MNRRSDLALDEMLSEIDYLEELASGLSQAEFSRNRTIRYAVERSIEIISEASRRLSEDVKRSKPEIDWRAISSVGNILRHEYHSVSVAIIWNVLVQDLRPLKSVLLDLKAQQS